MNSAFVCKHEGCGKSFKRRDRLDIHVRTHTGERPYVCHFEGCQSSYARSQHLSRHIETSHTSDCKALHRVECPHCKQELANKTCLKRHIKNFHVAGGLKTYKCPEKDCNESFHKKKQLVAHRLQHSDHLALAGKCYSCTHEGCGRTFAFPNKLKRHMKVHQGYQCDHEDCTEVLPNWSSLRKHKAAAHAPVHICSVCQATFKVKSNLTQHIKVHATSHQPIKCPQENCGRIFFYKKNLTQHIREFHDGETIWKNRKRLRPFGPHKKRKPPKKKSLAARLCGFDDRGDEVKLCSNAFSDMSAESDLCPDNQTSPSNSAIISVQAYDRPTAVNETQQNCDSHLPDPSCFHQTQTLSLQNQTVCVQKDCSGEAYVSSEPSRPTTILGGGQVTVGKHAPSDLSAVVSRKGMDDQGATGVPKQTAASSAQLTIVIENQDMTTEEIIVSVIA